MSSTTNNANLESRGGCPVTNFDFASVKPFTEFTAELDSMRDGAPYYWDTAGHGFWIVTRYDDVREVLQNPKIFTNESIDPKDPEPGYRLVPSHFDPPEHAHWRRLVDKWLSPRSVRNHEGAQRRIAADLVSQVAPIGHDNIITGFGRIYPAAVFLDFVGLPVEDAERVAGYIDVFHEGFSGEDKSLPKKSMDLMVAYFEEHIEDRRSSPRDPDRDLVTHIIQSEIHGRRLADDEVHDILFELVLGGVETTRGQLGFLFEHFATNTAQRRRLVAEPELANAAVEESLRTHTVGMNIGRKVAEDIDFHGVPMKKGDMVCASLRAANRDPQAFDDPTEFSLDRVSNAHFGFGGGIHRCSGSHLARQDMVVALQEWHKQIPDYRLGHVDGGLLERGQTATLLTLPLEWD